MAGPQTARKEGFIVSWSGRRQVGRWFSVLFFLLVVPCSASQREIRAVCLLQLKVPRKKRTHDRYPQPLGISPYLPLVTFLEFVNRVRCEMVMIRCQDGARSQGPEGNKEREEMGEEKEKERNWRAQQLKSDWIGLG